MTAFASNFYFHFYLLINIRRLFQLKEARKFQEEENLLKFRLLELAFSRFKV